MKIFKNFTSCVLCALLVSMQVSYATIDTGLGKGLGGADINSYTNGLDSVVKGTNSADLNFKGNSIVNWNNLNLNKGETLNFNAVRGGNNLTILNTVNQGMSKLYGNINANKGIGNLIISNPNGILFDGTHFTAAGDLTISTQNMSNVTLEDLNNNDFSNATFSKVYDKFGKPVNIQMQNNATFEIAGKYNIVTPGLKISIGGEQKLVTDNGQDYIEFHNNCCGCGTKAVNNNGNVIIIDVEATEIATEPTNHQHHFHNDHMNNHGNHDFHNHHNHMNNHGNNNIHNNHGHTNNFGNNNFHNDHIISNNGHRPNFDNRNFDRRNDHFNKDEHFNRNGFNDNHINRHDFNNNDRFGRNDFHNNHNFNNNDRFGRNDFNNNHSFNNNNKLSHRENGRFNHFDDNTNNIIKDHNRPNNFNHNHEFNNNDKFGRNDFNKNNHFNNNDYNNRITSRRDYYNSKFDRTDSTTDATTDEFNHNNFGKNDFNKDHFNNNNYNNRITSRRDYYNSKFDRTDSTTDTTTDKFNHNNFGKNDFNKDHFNNNDKFGRNDFNKPDTNNDKIGNNHFNNNHFNNNVHNNNTNIGHSPANNTVDNAGTNAKLSEKYYIRALQKYMMGDLEGSKADLSKSIQNNAQNAEAFYYRATINKQLGDITGYQQDFAKATNLNAKFIKPGMAGAVAFAK